jgi:hypothetical protein
LSVFNRFRAFSIQFTLWGPFKEKGRCWLAHQADSMPQSRPPQSMPRTRAHHDHTLDSHSPQSHHRLVGLGYSGLGFVERLQHTASGRDASTPAAPGSESA